MNSFHKLLVLFAELFVRGDVLYVIYISKLKIWNQRGYLFFRFLKRRGEEKRLGREGRGGPPGEPYAVNLIGANIRIVLLIVSTKSELRRFRKLRSEAGAPRFKCVRWQPLLR